MNEGQHLTPNWTRQLGDLRTRALRLGLRRPGAESPLGDVLEDALTTWGSLLKDFAGAQLECERLRAEVQAEAAAWQHFFDVMPGACVVTDPHGVILSANHAAGVLLHVNARHLKERQLLLFVEDRDVFADLLRRLDERSAPCRASLTLRPRERRPIATDVTVARISPKTTALLWFFVPGGGSCTVGRDVRLGDVRLRESA